MRITNNQQAHEALKGLKVGQKVRIKDDISGAFVVPASEMNRYKGTVSTIVDINSISVRLEGCGFWNWSADTFDVIKESVEMTRDEAREIVKGLKAGQEVQIKTGITRCLAGFSDDMKKYLGQKTKIIRVCSEFFVTLDCDGGFWSWSPDMFDVIEETKAEKAVAEVKKDVVFNGKLIKRVIFNNDATIVLFSDGTKAVTKRLPDEEDNKEHALAMALVKSVYGKNYFKDIFERFLPATETETEIRPLQKGDKVRIKSWEQMEEEFEVDEDGDIIIKREDCTVYFSIEGKRVCGNIITVRSVDDYDGEIYFEEECELDYAYVSIFEEMVERI